MFGFQSGVFYKYGQERSTCHSRSLDSRAWLPRLRRSAYMLITLVMTSLFGYALSVINIFGCGQKEGTVFESLPWNYRTHKYVRCQEYNSVLHMCFVISLANFQKLVSKYELGPSNQSEFFSWFYILVITYLMRALWVSESLYWQM